MTADDVTEQAAAVIEPYLPAMPDQISAGIAHDTAVALRDAGLLATPARDAAVAAKALRDIVAIFDGDCIELWEEFRWASDAPLGWSENSVAFAIESLSLIGPWLASRADRIEREGSDDA